MRSSGRASAGSAVARRGPALRALRRPRGARGCLCDDVLDARHAPAHGQRPARDRAHARRVGADEPGVARRPGAAPRARAARRAVRGVRLRVLARRGVPRAAFAASVTSFLANGKGAERVLDARARARFARNRSAVAGAVIVGRPRRLRAVRPAARAPRRPRERLRARRRAGPDARGAQRCVPAGSRPHLPRRLRAPRRGGAPLAAHRGVGHAHRQRHRRRRGDRRGVLRGAALRARRQRRRRADAHRRRPARLPLPAARDGHRRGARPDVGRHDLRHLGVTGWPGIARVLRAKTMQVRSLDYVVASRALGQAPALVMLRHVLPNVAGPLVVSATVLVAQMIVADSVLSYLGVGISPPTPTWGRMLFEGQDYYAAAPWLVAAPATVILLAVWGFNMLGEGLRDALDPHEV